MSIVKNIAIDGKQVAFKASAAIPRIYRLKFQRDIYKDLRVLEKSIGAEDENSSNLLIKVPFKIVLFYEIENGFSIPFKVIWYVWVQVALCRCKVLF